MSALALVVLVTLLPVGHGQQGQSSPSDCTAVRDWVDYLNGMIDRHHDLAQREVALTRDPGVSTEALTDGLAAAAGEREAANAEFQGHPVPTSAVPVQITYSLAWELDAQIANAYLRAVRTGDERQRGLADGYTEASSTIEARGARLLDALLSSCGT
jgi:hypothetical protein